jgi:aminobenzoyl-glutamate utilization protein A
MSIEDKILQQAAEMRGALREGRRDLHKYPETGWTEFRTAAKVAVALSAWGYEVKTGADTIKAEAMMGVPEASVLQEAQARAIREGADATWVERMQGGRTGIVATMRFAAAGPVVALRFDMDANDVTEDTAAAHFPCQEGFASVHTAAMHACGHDGHTTVGIAVAKLLAAWRDELQGTVKLIFQPAEEGVRGAKAMVENGDVDDVDYMLGAHFGFKMKKTGQIACNVKGFLATSKYDARFTGVPAHAGAAPETGKNALLASACAALNLHAISRHSAGVSRINVGSLEAGSGRNIIGDKALLKLETRGATSDINAYMEKEALRIIKAAAQMYDVQVDIKKMGGAAGGNNSPELADYIQQKAEQLGIFQEVVGACDFGASEDFSYFMERVQQHDGQAAYMMIGANLAAGHHDSHFDFDEKALVNAVQVLACLAVGLLQGGSDRK